MTTAMPPEDAGRDRGQPDGYQPSDQEIDRIFADMMAKTDFEPFNVDDVEADQDAPHELTAEQRAVLAQQARRRAERERRRAMREFSYQAHAEAEAEREAEYAADDEHFVPEDPPPIRWPRTRTVLGICLIAFSLFLVLGPNFLTISPTAVLLLAASVLVAGCWILLSTLRRSHPDDLGDDGARV